MEIIHDRFPIEVVQPLTDKEYYVRGCTALLDAVGQAINKIDNVQKHLPEEQRAGKVLFVITTDGLENSSTKFDYNDIRRKIEAKKECGWEFLFLGANIDAGKEAEKIGIKRNRSVTYENDHDGVALNYKTVGRAVMGVIKAEHAVWSLMTTGQMIFWNIMRRQEKNLNDMVAKRIIKQYYLRFYLVKI